MHNAHPYFSLKNLGKNMRIIHSKIRYSTKDRIMCLGREVSLRPVFLDAAIRDGPRAFGGVMAF